MLFLPLLLFQATHHTGRAALLAVSVIFLYILINTCLITCLVDPHMWGTLLLKGWDEIELQPPKQWYSKALDGHMTLEDLAFHISRSVTQMNL